LTNIIKFKFKFTGPLKRSTLDRQCSEPREEAINDLLHWLWSTKLQISRLKRSLVTEFKLLSKSATLKASRSFSATSYDEHILMVTAANLDRALKKARKYIPTEARLPESPQRALWLLRNIYEHWDQLRKEYRQPLGPLKGAALKLKEEFPDAVPWSITIDHKTGELTLANVIPLGLFVAELRILEARLLRLQRQKLQSCK
jgi:hypothetical protein